MEATEGGTASRSTYEHPTCTSAIQYAKKCCRDEEGNPWPPIPNGVWKGSVKVNELSKADVPTLDMMKLNRGQLYRNGRYPPFPTRKWKSKIVVCARWDRTTDEGALREWLDHHRCVSGTPKPSLPCMGFEPIVVDVNQPGDASLLPFCGILSSRKV